MGDLLGVRLRFPDERLDAIQESKQKTVESFRAKSEARAAPATATRYIRSLLR